MSISSAIDNTNIWVHTCRYHQQQHNQPAATHKRICVESSSRQQHHNTDKSLSTAAAEISNNNHVNKCIYYQSAEAADNNNNTQTNKCRHKKQLTLYFSQYLKYKTLLDYMLYHYRLTVTNEACVSFRWNWCANVLLFGIPLI